MINFKQDSILEKQGENEVIMALTAMILDLQYQIDLKEIGGEVNGNN